MRAQFAEGFYQRKRNPLVTRQMEQRIEQHRSVAVRDDETIAIGPERIPRIEFQVAREQRSRNLRHTERNALVTLAGTQDCINGQKADRVGLTLADLA